MRRSVLEGVAAAPTAALSGTFFRHAAPNRDAFAGGTLGRWGRDFLVIYMARPEHGSVIEAYRHLVEAEGIPVRAVQPRLLHTVRVDVEELLDLTDPTVLATVGLTAEDLRSPVDDYEACQEVAAAAHQLGRHGILAPAAHGLGQTLALFRQRLTPREMPLPVHQVRWEQLPPDPRLNRGQLRASGGAADPGA